MRLENKVALITGGARGNIGAAIARLFAGEGAKVVIGARRDEEGRYIEAEINEAGGDCLFVHLDVTSQAHWERAIEAAIARFGTLNILVNNASIGTPRGPDGVAVSIENLAEDQWNLVMAVNAKSVFLGTRAAIPEMRKAGGGSIINISSIAGLVGGKNAYGASKAAVRLFTKATAVQYAGEGIRANSVHPGPTDTPMSETFRADPLLYQWVTDRTPLGRFGQPEEIAYGVLYLASDESSFVTGSELVIDGGWTAQ